MANGRNTTRRSRPQLTGPKSVSFYADASGIDGIADFLDDLGDTVKEAIRPVAQAGAQVFYDRVKLNVAGMGKVSGNLDRAIYQKYLPEFSVEGQKALYRVSWNVTKAPHGRLLEHGWVQKYARFINSKGEWKTNKNKPLATPRQHPGYAFVGRAYAALPEAQAAMLEELNKRLSGLYYGGA